MQFLGGREKRGHGSFRSYLYEEYFQTIYKQKALQRIYKMYTNKT